jgi:hypothetical protein
MPAPAPRLTCGLALGGLDRLVGSGAGGVLGFGRGCVLGRRRLGLRLARRIDLGAVDLDQTDVDQCRFQACGRFPGALTLGADVRIDLHVVQTEGDQHLAVPFDGLHAPANQMLGFRGGDDGVEVPILRFIDRPGQSRDAARQERVAILGGDVLRTAEVADAAGDQLVLLDRSQFGPVKRLGLEQSRLEGRGGFTLAARPCRGCTHRPRGRRGESAPAGAAWDRQRRCSARPASWPRHPRP